MSKLERWEKAKEHARDHPDGPPAGVLHDPDEDVDPTDDGPPPPKDNEKWDGDPLRPVDWKPHGRP